MKRELRVLAGGNLDADVVAPAAVATGGVYLVLFLVTSILGELTIISLPEEQRAIANPVAALLVGLLVWVALSAWFGAIARSSGSLPAFVEAFHSISSVRHGSGWITVVVGVALIPAAQVVVNGGLGGFLWLAATSVWVGFLLAALGVRRGRLASQVKPPVEEASPPPAKDDWFTQFHAAMRDRGQMLGSFEASRSARKESVDDMGALQVALRDMDVPQPLADGYRQIKKRLAGGLRTLVLDMPRGGGLMPIISALSYEAVAREHGRILMLAPDRRSAGLVHAGLSRRLSPDTFWSSTTTIGLVGGTDGIVPGEVTGLEAIPHVAVLTPADLDVVLRLAATSSWADFFRVLRLVVILDADRYVGVSGSHLSALVRRVELLCGRLRVAPRYVLECPGGPGRRVFLARLTGLEVDPEAMIHVTDLNEKVVDVWDWEFPDETLSPIEIGIETLFAMVEQGGAGCLVLAGAGTSNSDIEAIRQQVAARVAGSGSGAVGRWTVAREPESLDPWIGKYDLAAVVGFPPSWARIKHDYGMLGCETEEETPARLALIPVDAVGLAFLSGNPIGGRDAALSFEPENASVSDLHLRAAIGSDSWLESELRAIGNSRSSLVTWREKGRLTFGPGVDPTVRPAPTAGAYFRPRLNLDSSEEATVPIVIAGARRRPLLELDASRALRAAAHQSLLLIEGERYEVEDVEWSPDGGLSLSVQSSAAIEWATHPLYNTSIERRSDGYRASQGALRRDRRRVEVREQLQGYIRRRILGGGGNPTRTEFDQAVEGKPYVTEAMSFGVELASGPTTTSSLHGAAHALRIAGHLAIEFRDDDLAMTVLERCGWMGDRPAIVVHDRAAGGLGIVRSFEALLEEILARALDFLESCDCGRSGCSACIDNPSCAMGLRVEDLDKVGALSVLAAMAGNPAQA